MTILMYHSISGGRAPHNPYTVSLESFRDQMQWLCANDFVATSLERALADGPRARRVVLTFDDVYRTIIDNAVPLLSELGFSATIFVPTGLVGGTNAWDAGRYPPEPLAGWDDLRALREGGFELGSHTVSHTRLTRLPWGARYREAAQSRAALAEQTGVAPLAFSYPWGACSPLTALAVRCAGYRAAVVTDDPGGGRLVPWRFRLPRVQISAADDLTSFAAIFAAEV